MNFKTPVVKIIFLASMLSFLLSINSCSYDENPCYEIECEENQVCIDGSCVDINKLTSKSNSAKPPKPDTVILYDFFITRYPPTKANGSNWDSDGSEADIYIQIIHNGKILYEPNSSIQDLPQDSLPYKIELNENIIINDVENVFTINFYEDDGFNGTDEFMGGITFTPFQKNYDATIQADLGGPVAMELSAIYEF